MELVGKIQISSEGTEGFINKMAWCLLLTPENSLLQVAPVGNSAAGGLGAVLETSQPEALGLQSLVLKVSD